MKYSLTAISLFTCGESLNRIKGINSHSSHGRNVITQHCSHGKNANVLRYRGWSGNKTAAPSTPEKSGRIAELNPFPGLHGLATGNQDVDGLGGG